MPNVVQKLAPPSQLMLVVALLVAVYHSVVKFNLAHLVGTLFGVALGVYNNDCLVKGNCKVWAWVLAGLYTFGAGAILFNDYENNKK
tara:strand:+ start:1913 stop:2173 length:261 start_codon:yes stop_codon:yes gene_type:complete